MLTTTRTPIKWASALALAIGLTAHAGLASAVDIVSTPTLAVEGHKSVAAPTIANQDRPGQAPAEGETIILTPGITDVDGDDTSTSTYAWSNDDGPITPETGGLTYVVKDTDLAKTITVVVTPATNSAETDPVGGDPVTVTLATGTTAANKPTSVVIHNENGALTGRPTVGEALTAVPTCPSTCDPSLAYIWKAGSSVVGDSSDTYTPVGGDQKEVITVTVPDTRAVQLRR
ncbi:hypothetical protein ACIQVE_01560 [Pseudomonas sp. NPDC098747]|uniref:hypothetical protein n=1 Tax=Pseudomonas sp. NPDC098747 TaxID=3364487 RepID=UPI00383BE97D